MRKILLVVAVLAAGCSFANAQGSPAAAPGESPSAIKNQSATPSATRPMTTAPVSGTTHEQSSTKQGPETGSAKDNASAPAR